MTQITNGTVRARRIRPMNTTNTAKAERAAKMLAFITEQANAGRTVYLATALRVTSLKRKHLPQVRVHNGALEIQCGKRWIDYTYTQVSAR